MAGLLVRTAEPRDLQRVYAIEVAAFTNPYSPLYLRLLLELAGDLFLVAEEYGEVTGYVIALPRRHGVCHIVSIAVDPRWRRRGVGKVLLHSIMYLCEEKGLKAFMLEVEHTNHAAQALYLSSGFKPVAMVPNYYGAGRHAVVMAALG